MEPIQKRKRGKGTKEKFFIHELKDHFRIRWAEDGKRKVKKARFGKRHTKEEAYELMVIEKKNWKAIYFEF